MQDRSTMTETKELQKERDAFEKKSHEVLTDAIKSAEDFAIEEENKNFNAIYTKQLKAKAEVVNEQTLTAAKNKDYSDNKSLDIDKSRQRLNETTAKYNADLKNDDIQREEARQFMKQTDIITSNQNKSESTKGQVKVDNVKDIASKEKTLQEVKSSDKKEAIYDTRSDLKQLEVSKVTYAPKVANTIGKNYPEGVSQEVFQENGPDGLPNAIITRRIVVKNGYGDVYTRTQKMGSITYSKNGDICTEMIWRNETTGPNLEKHY
jgi:hypothetical protein